MSPDQASSPAQDPEERLYSGEELETEDGTRVPRQMNVGPDNMEGGGEWPDPHTPPQAPAPGAFGESPRPAHPTDQRTEPHGP